MSVLNRCYQLVSGQYTSSSGTFTACSQILALQSHTLWHILQKYFLLTMISLIIISIFDWWSGQPHTCLNTLPTLDGLTVILIFHYWLWKCIESPWLHVTLVLVPRNILNNLLFFSFEPMLIRLKIVGDVKPASNDVGCICEQIWKEQCRMKTCIAVNLTKWYCPKMGIKLIITIKKFLTFIMPLNWAAVIGYRFARGRPFHSNDVILLHQVTVPLHQRTVPLFGLHQTQ